MQALLELDATLSTRVRIAERPGPIRTLAAILAHSGDSWFCLAALGLVWLFGEQYWRMLAITMIVAILVTAVLVMAVKFAVRRQRPEGEWGGIYRRTDPHSFPSGHAARAALLAVIAIGLAPTWLAVVLTIWAPLVGLARVAMGVHYLSDVLAGMLIGIVMGVIVLALI
jgi:undecaprenyl-diphosphatase